MLIFRFITGFCASTVTCLISCFNVQNEMFFLSLYMYNDYNDYILFLIIF